MIFNIMTLFPEMFNEFKQTSIIGRAIEKQQIHINLFNIRDYSDKKSKSVDDYVYGGGQGMLMCCQPIYDCYKDIVKGKKIRTLYTSPKGRVLNQEFSKELSNEEQLVILCGHYEGIDHRAIELLNAEEVSIGDYVLTGGEIPAMIIVDCVSRLLPKVLSNKNSSLDESFSNDLLEYPQYTRPEVYEGLKVPEILLSGDHKKVSDWRLQQSIEITKKYRPDLYKKYLDSNGGNYE